MTFQVTTTDIPQYNGFVKLLDVMGNDQAIIDSVLGFWTPQSITRDQDLIDYMYKVKHTSPFEMCEVKFHLKFNGRVIEKIFRHRTASVNVSSLRYEYLTDEFFDDSAMSDPGEDVTRPTTELVIKMNLRNFFNFAVLRLDPSINDALLNSTVPQADVHTYALAMYNLVKAQFPMACAAFEKYELNSVNFTSAEKAALTNVVVWTPEFEQHCINMGITGKALTDFHSKVASMTTNVV